MRVMYLDDVEARAHGAAGGVDVRVLETLDAVEGERLGLGVALLEAEGARGPDVVRPAVRLLRRGRAHIEPRRDGGRLAPRVPELDADLLVLRVREGDDLRERLDLVVGPEPGVFRGDAALWCDCGGLDHAQAGPAGDDAAHWDEEEVR